MAEPPKARSSKTSPKASKVINAVPSPRIRPIWATTFLILSLLFLVALVDYHPSQSPEVTTEAGVREANLVGRVGVFFSFWALHGLGMASALIPVYLMWLSYLFFRNARLFNWVKCLAIMVCLGSAAAFFAMIEQNFVVTSHIKYTAGLGGITGFSLYHGFFARWLGAFGGNLIIIVGFIAACIVLFHDNLGRTSLVQQQKGMLRRLGRGLMGLGRQPFFRGVPEYHTAPRESLPPLESKTSRRMSRPFAQAPFRPSPSSSSSAPPSPVAEAVGEQAPKSKSFSLNPFRKKPDPSSASAQVLPSLPKAQAAPFEAQPQTTTTPTANTANPLPAQPKAVTAPSQAPQPKEAKSDETNQLTIVEASQPRKAQAPQPTSQGNYHFPPITILNTPPATIYQSSSHHRAVAESLVRILDEFGVKVTLGDVYTGPVITRYEVYPAPGVRVEKISNLEKNIALGLKALSVRILAPVPGRGCVGIEIPNKDPSPVCLRDILESEDWVSSDAEIPVALGKKVSGEPLVADLTKMPHLLIAGSTGAGKTVCINAVITSLLYKSSPNNLRFVMVDPKIVEMQVFNDLPHMLIPVVTDPQKVPAALKYLIKEMEKRYKIFAKIGVRNIAGFNAKRAKDAKAAEQERELEAQLSPQERAAVINLKVERGEAVDIPQKLPYIICVVDELADLMMVAPADIETCIARLAQLARAAGIHLILATQRPSVNVITGVIKANLPSRIAFKVASKVDSRTILDTMGADQLIGKGDMLFLPPGSSELVRSQGAFLSDDEINNIVEYLKENNDPPEFDENFQMSLEIDDEEEDEGDFGEEGDYEDEMIPEALEVIRSSGRASTSMLQRRLRIGYNRAARIMEILESHEIVGPDNGSQPREILKDLETWKW